MLARTCYKTVLSRLVMFPEVVVLGPRQVGKTTLAEAIAAGRDSVYLDLENPRDRGKLADPNRRTGRGGAECGAAGAQHIDNPAPGDLALQTAQKSGMFRPFVVEAERLVGIRLGGGEKLPQFGPIDGMLPIVVPRVSTRVSGLFHKRGNDDRFQALFAGVACFHGSFSKWAMSLGEVLFSIQWRPGSAGGDETAASR